MRKYIVSVLLLVCIAVTACAHTKKTTRKKAPKSTKGVQITAVTMTRGACYGRCPIYTVKITADGMVEYDGKRFTKQDGLYRKQFSPARTAELFRQFETYGVDTCQAIYDLTISDLPGLSYIFIVNGKEQRIGNAHFGPEFLKVLAQSVDELATVDKSWKKIRDKAPDQ